VKQVKTSQDHDSVRSNQGAEYTLFNCYTRWMSLGADGTLENLIEEGLKQPDCIMIFFEKGNKEKKITQHIAPDQA
jgi:hypothetical protein